VLVLEVLLVSFGTLALIAITLGTTGVVMAFGHSGAFGWTLVGVLFVAIPAVLWGAFKVLPKLGFARGLYLQKPDLTEADRRAAAPALTRLLGATGEVTTPLRPSGTAVFGGEPVQVVTRGVAVAPGARVKVVDVTGNRVVVEEA
jgi:membrane-bound serine protease (ClpP class)